MKTSNTLLLLIIAAGVVGAIVYTERHETEIETSAAIPRQFVPAVTSSTVERITIHAPLTKAVTLHRVGEQWYTNVKQKYAADPNLVNQALAAIDEPIHAKVVSSNPNSFADYEVNDTSGTKVQVFEKGKVEPGLDMIVGKDGPTAFSTYVRLNVNDDVLNAESSLAMTFKRPDGWRNKQIFTFSGTNATRIEATGSSQTFALAKGPADKWMMETPEKAVAEAARASSLANMMGSLTANQFIDLESSQTLAQLGLEPARQTVTINFDDKSTSPSKPETATLLIGNESPTKGDWYAKRKDRNDIFTIGQHVADALTPDPTTLMAPKPTPTPAPPQDQATSATTTEAQPITSTPAPAPPPMATPVPTPEITPAPTPEATPTPAPSPVTDPQPAATDKSETTTSTTSDSGVTSTPQ